MNAHVISRPKINFIEWLGITTLLLPFIAAGQYLLFHAIQPIELVFRFVLTVAIVSGVNDLARRKRYTPAKKFVFGIISIPLWFGLMVSHNNVDYEIVFIDNHPMISKSETANLFSSAEGVQSFFHVNITTKAISKDGVLVLFEYQNHTQIQSNHAGYTLARKGIAGLDLKQFLFEAQEAAWQKTLQSLTHEAISTLRKEVLFHRFITELQKNPDTAGISIRHKHLSLTHNI